MDTIKTPKRIYVNIDKYNNNVQRQNNTISLNNSSVILPNINDYEMYIDRLSVPINLIGAMKMVKSKYIMTFVNSSGTNQYDLYDYVESGAMDSDGTIYDINVVVSAFNRMLSVATSDLTSSVVNICVQYNPESQYFNYLINSDFLISLNGTYDTNNSYTIGSSKLYFNQSLYLLFGVGFMSKTNGNDYLSNTYHEMHFTFYHSYLQQQTLMYTHTSIVNSGLTLIKFTQYKKSINNFNNVINKIVVTSNNLPIEGEYIKVGSNNSEVTGYLTQRIVTDFILETDMTTQDEIVYIPQNIRYISFTETNTSLQNIELSFWYESYDGVLKEIIMPQNSSITCKLCFVNRIWQK